MKVTDKDNIKFLTGEIGEKMNEDRQYTLEDIIKEERGLVNVNKSLYEVCALKEKNKHFLREAEKHRQKAEWLEELKWIKATNLYTQAQVDLFKQESYNKALDDVGVELLKATKPTEKYIDSVIVVKVLEQLKKGTENEQV